MRIKPKYTQALAILLLGGLTLISLLILVFIIVFILSKGLPVLNWEFLSSYPKDMGRAGGIFPMLIGTILLALIAIVIAMPLGVGTAIYLTEYTRNTRLTNSIRFGTDCLAGVPSIIFGLFGLIFFVTILKMGWSLLAGGLTLSIMILPMIIRTAEEAIKSVPYSFREVSYSLGATRWETIWKVVLPNALPGIVTGMMLSIGRTIGETAAVIFTAGSVMRMPHSVFDSVRTLSVHFYILACEGISNENAYGTAAVLIIAITLINLVTYWLMHRIVARHAR